MIRFSDYRFNHLHKRLLRGSMVVFVRWEISLNSDLRNCTVNILSRYPKSRVARDLESRP